ncbi:HAD family hydrolase [Rhizobium sp. R634]|nr:HAD family hydrolase [Rhizobium sp. R634]
MRPLSVVFDIGGVLIDWNPRYLYRKLLPDEESVEAFLRDVCSNEWNQQFDAGHIFSEGIAALAAKHPEKADLISAFWERWQEMLGGEVPGTADILRRLKRENVPVHAISNWSAETFPIATKLYPFLHLFDVLVVSGREKMIKPGEEIFQHFLERSGLGAKDCIFIDDNAANVAAANELGFHTVHFSTAEDLERRLVALGLLSQSGLCP